MKTVDTRAGKLRAVEYGQFERVGGSDTLTVDVRIVGATNGDMPAAVRAGQFRADLLDRLAFDVLTVPPLRARAGDLMRLAEHFALNISRELGRDVFAGFTQAASTALLHYPWPGNVRELKNVVERSVHRTPSDDAVDAVDAVDAIVFDPFASAYRPHVDTEAATGSALLAAPGSATTLPCDIKSEVSRLEVELIERALVESRHNQTDAAPLLGLSYHQLRALLRKHGIVKSRSNRDGSAGA